MSDGQVVMVTGAARGIGRAVAGLFAAGGATVVAVDRDAAELEAAVAELPGCEAAPADITRREEIRAVVEGAVERHGRLDALAASAGIAGVRPLLELDDAEWQQVIDVNLTGTFRCVQEAARPMAAAGRGAIVVTTSTNATWVESGTAHYSASKGGLLTFVRTAALDLAPYGIRVNAVAPGIVRTRLSHFLTEDPVEGAAYLERVPLGRFAEPADIAEAVVWLASDAARYVTGEQLVVDGGVSIGVGIPQPEPAG